MAAADLTELVEREAARHRRLARDDGGSFYGTRGGPIPPRPWGVTTQRGDTVWVHVLDWADAELSIPKLPRRVRSARLMVDNTPVPFRENRDGVTLRLPARDPAAVDQVIVLELARS